MLSFRKPAGEPSAFVVWTNGTGSDVAVGDLVNLGFGMGQATVDIANGAIGAVRFQGTIGGNLAAATTIVAGEPAYLNEAGTLTNDGTALDSVFVGYFVQNQTSGDTEALVLLAPFSQAPSQAVTLDATGAETLPNTLFGTTAPLIINVANSAAKTVTLPAAANLKQGQLMRVTKTGGGAFVLTLTAGSGSTINGGATYTAIDANNDTATFMYIGTNWVIIYSTIA